MEEPGVNSEDVWLAGDEMADAVHTAVAAWLAVVGWKRCTRKCGDICNPMY